MYVFRMWLHFVCVLFFGKCVIAVACNKVIVHMNYHLSVLHFNKNNTISTTTENTSHYLHFYSPRTVSTIHRLISDTTTIHQANHSPKVYPHFQPNTQSTSCNYHHTPTTTTITITITHLHYYHYFHCHQLPAPLHPLPT